MDRLEALLLLDLVLTLSSPMGEHVEPRRVEAQPGIAHRQQLHRPPEGRQLVHVPHLKEQLRRREDLTNGLDSQNPHGLSCDLSLMVVSSGGALGHVLLIV